MCLKIFRSRWESFNVAWNSRRSSLEHLGISLWLFPERKMASHLQTRRKPSNLRLFPCSFLIQEGDLRNPPPSMLHPLWPCPRINAAEAHNETQKCTKTRWKMRLWHEHCVWQLLCKTPVCHAPVHGAPKLLGSWTWLKFLSASPTVSHKRVFTLIGWQPGSANTGFFQAPPSYGSGRYGWFGVFGFQDSVLRDRCSVGTRHASFS